VLLLLGWMCLIPGLPVLAQTTTAPIVLPKILEFDRKLCPYCQASATGWLTLAPTPAGARLNAATPPAGTGGVEPHELKVREEF